MAPSAHQPCVILPDSPYDNFTSRVLVRGQKFHYATKAISAQCALPQNLNLGQRGLDGPSHISASAMPHVAVMADVTSDFSPLDPFQV